MQEFYQMSQEFQACNHQIVTKSLNLKKGSMSIHVKPKDLE